MSKKRVLSAFIDRPGKASKEILIDRSLGVAPHALTIGNDPTCNIQAHIQGQNKFLKKGLNGYSLRIPEGTDGNITIGDNTQSIKGIIELGFLKKKGDHFLLPIPNDKPLKLLLKDVTVEFSYQEVALAKEKVLALPKRDLVQLDGSLKRHWIDKEDYFFYIILIAVAVINFSTAAYLKTVVIRQDDSMEAITKIPKRFAKLILQPMKKEKIKKQVKKKAEEKVEEKKEKKKPKEKAKKKNKAKPSKKKKPSIDPAKRRARVKTKGLLGVIMAKSRPTSLPDDDIFKETGSVLGSKKRSRGGDALADIDFDALGAVEDTDITIETTDSRGTDEILKERRKVAFKAPKKQEVDVSPTSDVFKRRETEVYNAVRKYSGGLKYLYNIALRKNSRLKGTITVKLTINSLGRIQAVEIVSSTLDAPDLEKAIMKRIHRWRFSKLDGADPFVIDYTFDFSPVG